MTVAPAPVAPTQSVVPDEIPTLDIGPYLRGDADALEDLAKRLRSIQQEIGFYFIINHGVPSGLIARATEQLRRFYALPLQEKLKLRINAKSSGYVPAKSTVYVTSNVNQNTKPDLNECLLMMRERPADHPSIMAGRRFVGPNQWPDEKLVPGFRDTMLEYYAAMEALGYKMLPLYARALDLPKDYFAPFFSDPTWTTRNQYYPPVPAEENQFGISPHRDHGFLTLLPLSEEPGLEIRAPSGKWIPAGMEGGRDGIVVNTGEFLNRWSNGRFIATPHRVVPPKRDRYSIAFFFNPTWDTLSDALPTCVGPDHPPRFEPMKFLDYLCGYVDRNYSRSGGGQQDDAAMRS